MQLNSYFSQEEKVRQIFHNINKTESRILVYNLVENLYLFATDVHICFCLRLYKATYFLREP